jgi:membrane-associated phospholipid phosphatase
MVARPDAVLYIESHRKWYVAALIVSVIAFVWAALATHRYGIAGWEQRLMLDVNSWPNRLRTLAVALSAIGGSAWTAIITMALSYVLKLYRLTWRLAASFLVATALVYVAKHAVSQPEVFHLVPNLHFRVATSGLAFPSGTMTVATVIALSLLPYLSKAWRLLLPVWVVVIGIALLYLGVQTPLDLVGGISLGVFLVSLIRLMPQNVRVFLRLD